MMVSLIKSLKELFSLENRSFGGGFGKLPFKDEFVRYNVIPGKFDTLDKWVNSGFKKFVERYHDNDNIVKNFASIKFFINEAGKSSPIIGTIFSSHDKSQRQHPFTMFKTLSEPGLLEFNQIIPFLMHENIENAENELKNIATSVSKLEQTVDGFANVKFLLSKKEILNRAIMGLNKKIVINIDSLCEEIEGSIKKVSQSNSKFIKLPLRCESDMELSMLIFWLQLFAEKELLQENAFVFYQTSETPFLYVGFSWPDGDLLASIMDSTFCTEKVIDCSKIMGNNKEANSRVSLQDVLVLCRS